MPKSLDNQLSYSGGEFSPLLDARVDHPKYQSACRQLQNMIALRQGGCTRRPGTIFKGIGKFQDSDIWQYPVRLMSFQFSPTTSFIIEVGHRYMRFYSNQQQVILGSAPVWVALTPYVPGNFVEDPGDANNIYFCTGAVAGGVQPHLDGVHWLKQNIYEIVSPYNGRVPQGPESLIYESDVWRLVPCQINDVVYIVHPSYAPYKLERLADTNWTLTPVNFLTPAMLDQNPTGITIAPSAMVGAINLIADAPAWAAATYYSVGQSVKQAALLYTCLQGHVAAVFGTELAAGYWKLETIFTADNIGSVFQLGHIRNSQVITQPVTGNGTSAVLTASGDTIFETFGNWAATVDLERSDDFGVTWYKIRTITSVSDHNSQVPIKIAGEAQFRITVSNWTVGAAPARATFSIVSNIAYGLVQLTAVADAYHASGLVISRFAAVTATNIWSEGAWSARRGYPQAITAFQTRMIYGGSSYEPQRIWGTVTDDLENFDRGDQTLATDSFAFDIAAVGRGRIQWLIGQVDLFAGFSGAEWIINAGQGSFGGSNEPITPQAINAGEHSSFGSAEGIPPALVGNAVLYPQRSAKTIQQMMFSVYTNKYQSNELTSLSEHLFGAGVAQIAYQPQFRNQGVVWVVNKAGALCGMTYDMQSEVYAWHRHITGYNEENDTINFFNSVAVIDGQSVQDDEVWVVVGRGSGRFIELMNPENWETAASSPSKGVAQPQLAKAIYVDSAVTTANPVSNVLPGFDHLIDEFVVGLLTFAVNGNSQTFGPIQVAADGTVTIPEYEPQPGDLIQTGLPIDYAVQGMRLDVDGRAGIIIGVTKALSKVFLRVFNSLSGRVQGNGLKSIPINYRPQALPPDQGPPLFTGQREVVPEGTQTDDPVMIVKGRDPLPLTLLASTVRVGITGSA